MKDGVELRNSSGKGEGIFAAKLFKVGDIVIVGVIEEILKGNHSHASQIGENEYVLHAGLIIKVNHSCDPNCGIKVNETGAHNFVAMRNININEEITFDYAMRNYDVDYFPKQCMCGSKKCRSKITGWKNLPDETKKEYKGFVAPYLLELDTKNSC
ncbi:MAG: SET domain-containing protein [Proteobacteria bacterium]|nr:SET domain-containing protein [Pseudomonadota bacterium]